MDFTEDILIVADSNIKRAISYSKEHFPHQTCKSNSNQHILCVVNFHPASPHYLLFCESANLGRLLVKTDLKPPVSNPLHDYHIYCQSSQFCSAPVVEF